MSSSESNPDLEQALAEADDTRLTAITTGNQSLLEAVLSDGLHYAHSSGFVDDKASLIEALASGKTEYLAFDYVRRGFTFPAEDIALMAGQVRITSRTAPAEPSTDTFSFLAVWKLISGNWRFHAWQSARMPAAESAK